MYISDARWREAEEKAFCEKFKPIKQELDEMSRMKV
jgi:hypothetical protein